MEGPRIRLYGFGLSHPVRAARLMLEHKGLDYEQVGLPAGAHQLPLRLRGFPHGTVPAMSIDGEKVQGSLAISERLERLRPEPTLYDDDPERAAAIREAEEWAERELQPVARRCLRWSLAHRGGARRALAQQLGWPLPAISSHAAVPAMHVLARMGGASEGRVRDHLRRLPENLDRTDSLLEQGLIGGERPNAADFQIATSIRVAMALRDLAPLIEGRPCGRHAIRIVPTIREELPRMLPPEWVPQTPGARGGPARGS